MRMPLMLLLRNMEDQIMLQLIVKGYVRQSCTCVSHHLRIGFWNLNGFNSSILGNKLKTNDFLSIINKHDIFALVETHATYETEMNISKFKHFNKCTCRNQSGNRS